MSKLRFFVANCKTYLVPYAAYNLSDAELEIYKDYYSEKILEIKEIERPRLGFQRIRFGDLEPDDKRKLVLFNLFATGRITSADEYSLIAEVPLLQRVFNFLQGMTDEEIIGYLHKKDLPVSPHGIRLLQFLVLTDSDVNMGDMEAWRKL